MMLARARASAESHDNIVSNFFRDLAVVFNPLHVGYCAASAVNVGGGLDLSLEYAPSVVVEADIVVRYHSEHSQAYSSACFVLWLWNRRLRLQRLFSAEAI